MREAVTASRLPEDQAAAMFETNLHAVWLIGKWIDKRRIASLCRELAARVPAWCFRIQSLRPAAVDRGGDPTHCKRDMTETERTNIAILKWVVNPALPVPEIETLDEESFFHLVEYHRITGQVLARLEAARPRWCPSRFLTRLRIRQHHIRKEAQERMAAAREMSDAMQARGLRPPIFVKGFAAHALTADPANLHYSGDLDPFAEDLPAFWDVLQEIGYRGKRKDTHEWAKMGRGGITLDVHQHFSVLTYPDALRGVPREKLRPQENPGQWHLLESPPGLTPCEEVIAWKDLDEGAELGRAEGTRSLLFPSPTLLCLIHCIHCFRSSITRLHYMNPFGGFRLYELLAIRDLAQLPAFDWPRFWESVERFSARDAVDFIDALAGAFLGTRVLTGEDKDSDIVLSFPEQLIYGGWVSLQEMDEWLLLRHIEQLLEQLDVKAMPSVCCIETRTAPRVLTYGAAPILSLRVEIAWNRERRILAVDWSFAEDDHGDADHELMIHFGYGSYVQVRLNASGEISEFTQKSDYLHANQNPVVETAECGGDFSVRMICDTPVFPPCRCFCLQITSLFLAARRLRPDGLQTDSACYLPLILQNA